MSGWHAFVPDAIAACLFAVLTWQVIVGGTLTGLDQPVSRWAAAHGGRHAGRPWVALSELGDGRVMLLVAAGLAAAVAWRRAGPARLARLCVMAVALCLVAALLELGKVVIGRAEPGSGSDAAFAGGGAFPSGHTAAATVMCGVIAYLLCWLAGAERRPGCGWLCLAAGGIAGLCAGAAMVRLAYHWPTDAAGGWLLGIVVLHLMLAALRRAAGPPAGAENAQVGARRVTTDRPRS